MPQHGELREPLGYRRRVTYTHASESGVSLRAAGFKVVHQTKAEHWHREARPRVDLQPLQRKLRWERVVSSGAGVDASSPAAPSDGSGLR